jgi:hypothetical protein
MFGRAPRLILGKETDLASGEAGDEPVELALRDLSWHMLCAASDADASALANRLNSQILLQDVPCIAFDARGDLLMDSDGLSPDDFAQRVSVTRYTPGIGASAGIFAAYMAPPDSSISWQRQGELLREHISRLCRSLLERLGLPHEPATSREHVLLASIIESAWRAGQRIDPPDLVRMINQPPLNRIGGFDMDVFIPTEHRAALALAFSEFAAGGLAGHADDTGVIDAARLLQPDRSGSGVNPAGRTRATVFDLSHLDARDRRFFTSTVMAQLLLWMRMKSGVPHLRCIVHVADADGLDPEPLHALLRYGRAAGFGVVLQTAHLPSLGLEMLARFGAAIVGHAVVELGELAAACPNLDRHALLELAPHLPAGAFLLCIGAGRDRAQPPQPAVFRLV